MATLILKPTEACNAACAYCEVDGKGWRATKIMPFDILERLFIRIDEFLRERKSEYMEVIWHGGEPLLLGENILLKPPSFSANIARRRVTVFDTESRATSLFSRPSSPACSGNWESRASERATILSKAYVC